MSKIRWQDWVEFALGAWLAASPWILGFERVEFAMWNAVILGAAIMIYALVELGIPRAWEEWFSMAMGAWLVVSPFALRFSTDRVASWNTIAVGVLIAVFAAWALALDKEISKWWHDHMMGH